jgi:hypothetical protein
VRDRIAAILEKLVRLRDGEFAFNLTQEVPITLAGRDLSDEMLPYGINPEELMLDLAKKLDEDRRDAAAALEASFVTPTLETAQPPADAAPAQASPAVTAAYPALQLEELELETEPAPIAAGDDLLEELALDEPPAPEPPIETPPIGAAPDPREAPAATGGFDGRPRARPCCSWTTSRKCCACWSSGSRGRATT